MILAPASDRSKGGNLNFIGLPAGVMLILWFYLTIMLVMSVSLPFPSQFDELQHLSMIRSEADHPTLFPAYDRQYVLQENTEYWSSTKNYINHPSLYYLILAPVVRLGGGILLIRLLNAGLSFLALVITVRAGCRVLHADRDRTVFAILAASFPKGAEIGGMINNDNLAAVAGSLVFAGLASDTLGVWMIAGGLALAGWTKLTALIGLGALALAAYVTMIWMNRLRFSLRQLLPILGGLLLGAIPYLWNLLESSHLLYVSRETYYAPPDQRPALTFIAFAARFFDTMAVKWPAAEGSLPLWLAVPFFLFPFAVAGLGMRHMRADKRIAEPYAIALIALAAIHLAFGWYAFKTMGDLTIAQTRYYNVLWPGIALAGTVGIMALTPARRVMRGLFLGFYMWPTALGGLVLTFAVHAT